MNLIGLEPLLGNKIDSRYTSRGFTHQIGDKNGRR